MSERPKEDEVDKGTELSVDCSGVAFNQYKLFFITLRSWKCGAFLRCEGKGLFPPSGTLS